MLTTSMSQDKVRLGSSEYCRRFHVGQTKRAHLAIGAEQQQNAAAFILSEDAVVQIRQLYNSPLVQPSRAVYRTPARSVEPDIYALLP